MEDDENTTIPLKLDTKRQLNKFKVHPRESYDEVLNRIMENTKFLGEQSDD